MMQHAEDHRSEKCVRVSSAKGTRGEHCAKESGEKEELVKTWV